MQRNHELARHRGSVTSGDHHEMSLFLFWWDARSRAVSHGGSAGRAGRSVHRAQHGGDDDDRENGERFGWACGAPNSAVHHGAALGEALLTVEIDIDRTIVAAANPGVVKHLALHLVAITSIAMGGGCLRPRAKTLRNA